MALRPCLALTLILPPCLGLALGGCTSAAADPTPAPAQTLALATAAGTATPAGVSVGTERLLTPVPLPSPIASDRIVHVDSWSPDSRWLAFSAGDGFGRLHFLDLATGQTCRHDELQDYLVESGEPLGWLADGSVVAAARAGPMIGRPCAGAFTSRDPTRQPWPTARPGTGDLSPDGRLRARTRVVSEDSRRSVAQCETQLVDVATGQASAALDWDSLIEQSACYGGTWLPDGRYLLEWSVRRGPLLLSPDGTAVEVADALFHLPAGYSPGELGARVYRGPGSSTWHLQLSGPSQNECMLYHPELDVTEALPCAGWAPVAPPGWLVRDASARPVDPPGSPYRAVTAADGLQGPFVSDKPSSAWNADGSRLAVVGRLPSGAGEVRVAAFPSDEVTARWPLAAPMVVGDEVVWSPDGRHVAIVVTGSGDHPEELVVLDAGAP